ncbi:MAG: hypothetical protein Q4P20_06085 [Eubacteriales bacterium]|nr:hypothetical protein [Eubacteriales bacterium]
MSKYNMDTLLRQALAPVQPSEQLNQTLKAEMEAHAASGKAGIIMKFRKKKIFILSAAICAVLATVAIASSGVISYVTGYSSSDEYTSFSQLNDVEDKADLDIHAVEQFENGYSFHKMYINYWTDHDESGNALSKYKGIHITYQKDGEPNIWLDTEHAKTENPAKERTPVQTKTIQGIDVHYFNDTYKFVPVDYELTPEDEENLNRDDYFISEGADEISITMMSCVSWKQNGIAYSLICDCPDGLPAETLFDMAAELIGMS